MKNPIHYYLIRILIITLFFWACDNDQSDSLTVSPDHIDFGAAGGDTLLLIESSASMWNIENQASEWLVLSAISGNNPVDLVKVKTIGKTLVPRKGTLIVTAGDATPVQLIVSQASSEFLYTINASPLNIEINQSGSAVILTINTDAPQWNIESSANWLQFDKTNGLVGNTNIYVTALFNNNSENRYGEFTINAGNAASVNVSVTQRGDYFPSYNTSPLAPDPTGMISNAVELAAKINLGWNIGNTLEAIGGETAWGNPKVTKALLQLVKANGFNAVRIPCSWYQNMENPATSKIKESWLNRVKEVVQYAVDEEMYVILNIHWDGGWLENNCTLNKQEAVNARQKAFWEQIATHLRNFDEHLLFASANEPNVENSTDMAVLLSYHQTFINAVRSTGGKNSYRVLVVQGPSTDIEKTNQLMKTLPNDEVNNRLMAEIHFYTPYQFCLMSEDANWGKMFYYWGKDYHSTTDLTRNATWGEESAIDSYFALMKKQFVNNGIPVVLGEYGTMQRLTLTGDDLTLHLASRAYYLKYVTKQAIANGLLPFYWDNGFNGNNTMALFNRTNNTVYDQQALDALVEGSKVE